MELRFALQCAVHRLGYCHRCVRVRAVADEVGKPGRWGHAAGVVLEDSRRPRYFGFGQSRSSMSGPNTSQVLANSFGETAMRGNVGAIATKCGRLGSRWRFFRSIEWRSESRASFLSSSPMHGLMELPNICPTLGPAAKGIPVDVVGVREVKHRTPGCSDRSRCCAVGGQDFAGLGVANPGASVQRYWLEPPDVLTSLSQRGANAVNRWGTTWDCSHCSAQLRGQHGTPENHPRLTSRQVVAGLRLGHTDTWKRLSFSRRVWSKAARDVEGFLGFLRVSGRLGGPQGGRRSSQAARHPSGKQAGM